MSDEAATVCGDRQQESEAVDFNLYQALREARPLVVDHDGEPWQRLRTTLDAVFASLAEVVGDVAYDRDADRFDRTRLHDSPFGALVGPDELDTHTQDQAIASLHALYDRPGDDTATAAADALEALRAELKR